MWTYNLGFFLGPGLPLSRGGAFGSMAGGARFRPVMVPPALFFFASAFGGASELGSVSSLAFVGIGVSLDSDDFSALSGGWRDGEGSGLTFVSEAGLTSDGNWERASGERLRITILLFFAVLDVDFEEVLVDDMVGDGVVDG